MSDVIVTMNRDESVTRPEASPHLSANSWRTVDAKAGGSWFGVHRDGWALALLNRYQDEQTLNAIPSGLRSRGAIIPWLLESSSWSSVSERVNNLNFHQFAPFNLVGIYFEDAAAMACEWQWDGQKFHAQASALNTPRVWISSSVDILEANRVRSEAFSACMEPTTLPVDQASQALMQLHLTSCANNPSLGFAMRRPGRATRSVSQACLGARTLDRCCYQPLPIAPLSSV